MKEGTNFLRNVTGFRMKGVWKILILTLCNEARPIVLMTRRGLCVLCLPCWPIQKRTIWQKLFAGERRLFRLYFQICSQILSLMSKIRRFSKHFPANNSLERYAMPPDFWIISFILSYFHHSRRLPKKSCCQPWRVEYDARTSRCPTRLTVQTLCFRLQRPGPGDWHN